jgi:hypothetical protein
VQPARPEVASVPENETVSAWFHHPFESAARDGAAPLTVGGVLSSLTVTVTVFVIGGSSELEAVQESGRPVVSTVSVVLGQLGRDKPFTSQRTVTLVVYQPAQLAGAGEQMGVITGSAAVATPPPPEASVASATAKAMSTMRRN